MTEKTAEQEREVVRKAEQEARVTFAQDRQDSLSNMAARYSKSKGAAIPALPAGPLVYLSPDSRAHLSSAEHGRERTAKGAGLAGLEKELAERTAEVHSIGERLKEMEAKRKALMGNGAALDERVQLDSAIAVLGLDLDRASAGLGGLSGRVAAIKQALRDPLVQWAEVRRDWCNEALRIVAAAKIEADAILEAKAAEISGDGRPPADDEPEVMVRIRRGIRKALKSS